MGGRWAPKNSAHLFFFEEDGRLKKKKRGAKDGRINFQKNGICLRSKRHVSKSQIILLIFWGLKKIRKKTPIKKNEEDGRHQKKKDGRTMGVDEKFAHNKKKKGGFPKKKSGGNPHLF